MKRKWLNIFVILLLAFAVFLPKNTLASEGEPTKAVNEKLGVPIVVYGANLSAEQKNKVKEALRVDEEPEVDEIVVSGKDLSKYITGGNPSARMYSSAKITRQDEGKGLVINIVTPENITEVTSEIYANAMLTAGIEDAVVEVAAPKPVTGHSALVGIYKAYEVKTGETLDTKRTDVANDELALATDIADNSNVSNEKVAELLTNIKQQLADKNPATKEDVQKIVEDELKKLNIELSESDKQKLVDLMNRINDLDIDFSKLSEQLDDVKSKIEEKLSELADEDSGFWQSVKSFFKNLFDSISSWFE